MDTFSDIPSFSKTLILAFGFAFVIEGLFYAVFARRLPQMFEILAQLPESSVRRMGIIVALMGLGWMVLVRYFMFDPV